MRTKITTVAPRVFELLKNHIIEFILALSLLTLTFGWIIGVFVSLGANDIGSLAYNTISEYQELDRTHLANLTKCIEVEVMEGPSKIYFVRQGNKLVPSSKSMVSDDFSLSLGDTIIYPFDNLMKITIKDYNTSFVLRMPEALTLTLLVITAAFFIFLIGGLILLDHYILKVRKNDLISFSAEKSGLQNLITSVLSENLHHEMKTPLCSISIELNNIKNVMSRSNNLPDDICGGCGIVEMTKDAESSFDIIEQNVQSIYNIIETIKNSKKFRQDDDRKNLYDIAYSSAHIIKETSKVKNFKIIIDEKLKGFKLSHFRSEDLVNIFINHLKNSIEANSTRIVFDCPSTVDENGFLTLFIVDNGNGIPDNAKNSIYNLHFSTKDPEAIDDSLRGVGLFLSREILRTYAKRGKHHGDEWVYETSREGTTFGMKIPADINT